MVVMNVLIVEQETISKLIDTNTKIRDVLNGFYQLLGVV